MKLRSFVVGSTVAAVVVGALTYSVAAGPFKSAPTHSFVISFPTGDGLVPGSDVFEAGARIGSIDSIEPAGDRAEVTVQIEDSHWPLHQGLTAGIRPKSLLGEKYVDLHDSTNPQTYDVTQVLQTASDSVPVELDQFINSLTPDARTSAKVLINDLGAGIAGRGPDLNSIFQTGEQNLQHLALTGQTLNNRDPDLDRIIIGLNGVLGKLTQNDQLIQMSQLISNGQATLNAIEAESQTFTRSFVDANTALTNLNQAFGPAIASLKDAIATLPHMLSVLGQEADLLAYQGGQLTNGPLLGLLENSLIHGGTASGGAVESVGGHKYPIFRVCNIHPQQVPNDTSCEGNGFKPGQTTTPVPPSATTSAPAGNGTGSDIGTLVGFLGA